MLDDVGDGAETSVVPRRRIGLDPRHAEGSAGLGIGEQVRRRTRDSEVGVTACDDIFRPDRSASAESRARSLSVNRLWPDTGKVLKHIHRWPANGYGNGNARTERAKRMVASDQRQPIQQSGSALCNAM
jgi:hypothetical protein